MALRSPSSTPPRVLGPGDSPPADSPPPTSQCGCGNGARADVARKTKEVEHMLANLEKEGVEIDGKIASIIDDEVARIKAEAAREKLRMNKLKRKGVMALISIVSVAYGFLLGVDWYEDQLYTKVARIICYGEE
ncbi:hypothetical protein SEVIR_2G038500v4 [Setaria viridis]|uniref:Uncharacterized protein n=1 Tax=Setaria viridis TaxID=4556 RepID=A0A4U6VP09_SETVI|nr:uncharacterized protein LOC117843201 isoform X2 [Setaria viridis]TKW30454.1 hypothetical protein SEVIR_2G038500v2 [Setaria viridis]